MIVIILFFAFLISFFAYQQIDYLKSNTTEKQDIYIRYKEGKISFSQMKKDLKEFNKQFNN